MLIINKLADKERLRASWGTNGRETKREVSKALKRKWYDPVTSACVRLLKACLVSLPADILEERTGARVCVSLIFLSLLILTDSELLDFQAIIEEEESGSGILGIGGVAEAHSAIGVVGLSIEGLHLVNLGEDKGEEVFGISLEGFSTFHVASSFELCLDLGKVGSGPCHDVLLSHSDFVELERVDEVNDGGCVLVFLNNIIRCDGDLVGALLGVAGLDFEAGTVVSDGVRV